MFNTTYQGLMDIRLHCAEVLGQQNLEHPKNSNITLYSDAKWILDKTRAYPSWVQAYCQATQEPISIPLTEGILIRLENIKEILEHHNVEL